jgi:hypothetical protein
MDYQALKTELSAPQYQGIDDDAAAGLLNATTLTMNKPRVVTGLTVLNEIGPVEGAEILDKLQAAGNQVSAVKWGFQFLMSTGLDVGAASTQGQIQALVAAGVLTSAEGTALINMALQPCSRADQLGLGYVSEYDVSTALETVSPTLRLWSVSVASITADAVPGIAAVTFAYTCEDGRSKTVTERISDPTSISLIGANGVKELTRIDDIAVLIANSSTATVK